MVAQGEAQREKVDAPRASFRRDLEPAKEGGIYATMPFDKDLVALLACPRCHKGVRLTETEAGFACDACLLLFPIVDGIPNFLLEEAQPLPR
jgi:uncharacterized protein YbaR (Trm112 family)